MAGAVDVRTESRALRRAELLLARVREDCGTGWSALATIEPLLTRIDSVVEEGGRPSLADIDGLASASRLLESVPLHAQSIDEALRHNLASELGEIAERLRPVAENRLRLQRSQSPRAH